MSRNAISANPEHYIFKIFRGSIPPNPPRRPKTFFSPPRDSKNFFQDRFSPKTKILDTTLFCVIINLSNFGINPIAYGGRGGFLARAIRLSAITLEPFHLGSPNFLTSLFTLWTHCGEISGKLIFQGGCCSNFSNKAS